MITAEQIPDEVVEAARIAFANAGTADDAIDPIRAAIAAALSAWPGAWHVDAADFEEKLILPLTQEDNDDQG